MVHICVRFFLLIVEIYSMTSTRLYEEHKHDRFLSFAKILSHKKVFHANLGKGVVARWLGVDEACTINGKFEWCIGWWPSRGGVVSVGGFIPLEILFPLQSCWAYRRLFFIFGRARYCTPPLRCIALFLWSFGGLPLVLLCLYLHAYDSESKF